MKNLRDYLRSSKSWKIHQGLMHLGATTGCHQMPERSFFWRGKQFPVCARCTGVFSGYLIGICILMLHRISLCLCIILMLVMFYDWYVQFLRIKASTNIRRFLSGLLYGIGWVNFVAEIVIMFSRKILGFL